MLSRLSIRDYALIKDVELDFASGFTVITGETGSGKSIMLGALTQLLGARTDSRVAGEGKAYIEAEFTGIDSEFKKIFESLGVDWIEGESGGEVIIRREISSKGRSRVFMNDTPVALSALINVGNRLMDIHAQESTLRLTDAVEQMRIVDIMAENSDIIRDYKNKFRQLVEIKHRIDAIKERILQSGREEELLRNRFEQLDRLKPKAGELAEIERRYEMLSDAGMLKERLTALTALTGENESGIVSRMEEVRGLLSKIDTGLFENIDGADSLEERVENLLTEIKDISGTIEDMNQSIDTDPATLDKLSVRMQMYYDALRRFKLTDVNELEGIYDDLKTRLSELGDGGTELPELEKEARKVASELRTIAENLTKSRKRGAEQLEKAIIEETKGLGLNNLKFEVMVGESRISSTGKDNISFYCTFNKNGELRSLGEVASGGEKSRLMLGLKSLLAKHMSLPTLIFDEIDTGVSGDIADRMGKMMQEIGNHIQVIAITHLPQVAARGKSHFKVYKRDNDERTETRVLSLNYKGRKEEIASMISGQSVTEAGLQAAEELLRAK